MHILPLHPLPIHCARHRIDLFLHRVIITLHYLDPAASLRLISDRLPLESLGLQQILEHRVHLQLTILLIVVEREPDHGAVHMLPDVSECRVHERGELILCQEGR
jgi:hypothetical protein